MAGEERHVSRQEVRGGWRRERDYLFLFYFYLFIGFDESQKKMQGGSVHERFATWGGTCIRTLLEKST